MKECPNCGTVCSYGQNICPECGNRNFPPPNQGTDDRPFLRGDLDISETFSITIDIFSKNWVSFLAYWSIPVMLAVLLGFYSNWMAYRMVGTLPTADLSEVIQDLMRILFLALSLSLVVWIIQLIFIGGLVGMTKEVYESGKTSVDTGFKYLKKYPLGVLGAGILLTILISIGLVLCLIPGLLFCYWWVFTIPILVIEGKGISEAMSTSKDFADRFDTLGFTLVLMLVLVAFQILGGWMGSALSSLVPGFYTAQMMLQPVFNGIVSLILVNLVTIALTVHYLRARLGSTRGLDFDTDVPGYRPPAPPIR